MANVTYKPAPGDPAQVNWGGQTFEANKSVKVDNPGLLAKAQGNPFFEVSASKDEQRQAEVVGGFRDANSGDDIELVRMPRRSPYGTAPAAAPGITPPTPATQGSTATIAAATGDKAFEDTFGASRDEVASGEYEGAPEYVGPQGTEGAKASKASTKPAKK